MIKNLSKSQIYSILVLFFFALKVMFNYYTLDMYQFSYYDSNVNEKIITQVLSTFKYTNEFFMHNLINCYLFFLIVYFNTKKLKELGFKNYTLFLSFIIVIPQINIITINILFLIITANKKIEQMFIKTTESLKNERISFRKTNKDSYLLNMEDKFEKTLVLGFMFISAILIKTLSFYIDDKPKLPILILYLIFVFLSGFFTFEEDSEKPLFDAAYMSNMMILLILIFSIIFTDIFNRWDIPFLAIVSYPVFLIVTILLLYVGNLASILFNGNNKKVSEI